MKIYFAGAIRAGRDLQPTYLTIVQHLNRAGHIVLTEHVADQNVLDDERLTTEEAIYVQDTAWLDECEAMVAEVTIPSLGVGYEIAYALHKADKPVLCLCRQGTHLSAMILGSTAPRLRVVFYDDVADMLRAVDEFVAALGR
ncbi:MAG: nucleoside 2-deoxyribosyltransferase [Anaerolineae bacterium]|nr:nucleoside 2-deoxyribosyltransferase [Anaerolineae bacterium]